MASAYCTKGKEILQDLQRSELLSVYDDEAIRLITNEMGDMVHKLGDLFGSSKQLKDDFEAQSITREELNAKLKPINASVLYYKASVLRDDRYLCCYLNTRLTRIASLRWQAGVVLPEHLAGDTLSVREQEYFAEYNALLSSYLADVDLDLTNDLEPPRELLIEIRVLKDCGEIMTDSGPVNLQCGTTHFLRRSDVEPYVRQGLLVHVSSDANAN